MAVQRYRDLQRPALIDVAARSTPSGASEAASALAESLASFSRTGFNTLAPVVDRNLAKAGTEAGQEVTGTPEFKSTLTAYGQAYNNAALRSYAIRSEKDMDEQAARVEAEAGTDPEAFRSAMQSMQEGVLAEAPPEARGILSEMYTKRTGAGLARIQVALANELRAEDQQLVEEQIGRLTEKVAFLRASDTPEAHQQSVEEEAKLFTLLDAAVADGTLSEAQGRMARSETEYRIVSETVMARFKNEMDDPYGDPIRFIQDLKEANRTANTLTPEKEQQLENDLLAELRERNSLRAMKASQEAAEVTARYDAGDREATSALLAGTLTQRGLLERIRDDTIRPEIARTLLNELQSQASSPPKSDPETLFTVGLHVLEYSEEEIATLPGLTFADRGALIEKRRKDAEGWKSTQRAKEGFARVDRALGLVPGVMNKLLTPEEARARDVAYTQLYDAIDALPPEEREANIFSATDEVIKTVIKQQAVKSAERARNILAEYKRRMGDPDDLSDREREQYDAEVSRLENSIREDEQRGRN